MKHKDFFKRVANAEKGRLRLCVFRSNNHIYGQIIDDSKDQVTLGLRNTADTAPRRFLHHYNVMKIHSECPNLMKGPSKRILNLLQTM